MEKITLRQLVLWIIGLFIGWRWIVIYSVWINLLPDQTLFRQLWVVDRFIFDLTSISLISGISIGILYIILSGNDLTIWRKPPNHNKIHEQAGKLLMNGKTKEADTLLDSIKTLKTKVK